MLRLEIEKALPLYLRYLQIAEKAKGKESDALVIPLRALALIQVSTDLESEAKNICERISKITKKDEDLPSANINLSKRVLDDGTPPRVYIPITSGFRIFAFPGPIANVDLIDVFADGLSPALLNDPGFINLFSPAAQKIPKRVNVKVKINERGRVIEANAVSKEEALKKRAEKEVLRWKFRPFTLER